MSWFYMCGTFPGGAAPLTRVPTRLATGHTCDHSRLKSMASERGNMKWMMSEEESLQMDCLDYSPLPAPHIDDSPILSTQMFPNLDHFVWELSVTKTSASPCVGIENPLFITLDPPSSFLTHVTMWKILWGRGTNRKSGLEKEDKSTLIQFLKFFSFLTDVTTTVIESPTAAEMSQPKTISHKVFPIPHYLTTWPTPDYLTIWLFGDRMEVRVRREVGLIIPLTDWPLLASPWFDFCPHLTRITHVHTLIIFLTDWPLVQWPTVSILYIAPIWFSVIHCCRKSRPVIILMTPS